MKGCWILSKAFSASIERTMWFLSLLLFICCIMFMDYVSQTILAYLEWNQLGHGVWTFWHVVEFCLPVFCWESLHLCSLKILVYNSLFWLYLYWVLEWV
jgi:hypothetical protein